MGRPANPLYNVKKHEISSTPCIGFNNHGDYIIETFRAYA